MISEEPSTMSHPTARTTNLEFHLSLIQVALKILGQNAEAQGKRDELLSMEKALRSAATDELMFSDRLLPDFLERNPDLLPRMVFAEMDDKYVFIQSVLDYYEQVKQQRDFTDEDKAVGHALLNLLDSMNDTLLHLKKDSA
jgi:hypothetical protein